MGIIHHIPQFKLGNIHQIIDFKLYQEFQKFNIPLINSNFRDSSKLAYTLQTIR